MTFSLLAAVAAGVLVAVLGLSLIVYYLRKKG